jgi:hypothetical protein
MGRTCIKDHRPDHSLGNGEWLNGCAQCEVERLRAFVAQVMEAWPLGDVDGGDLQDYAVKHGLLTPETRTSPCGEDGACNCAGYYGNDEWADGITCYRRPPWMRAA